MCIQKDPEYVQRIKETTPPTTLRSLQRTLGLMNWCSRFIPNYATRAQPLYDLLRQSKKWQWREEHSQYLEGLKEEMMENVMLMNPDWSRDFVIIIEASMISTAPILYQEEGEKKRVHYN